MNNSEYPGAISLQYLAFVDEFTEDSSEYISEYEGESLMSSESPPIGSVRSESDVTIDSTSNGFDNTWKNKDNIKSVEEMVYMKSLRR